MFDDIKKLVNVFRSDKDIVGFLVGFLEFFSLSHGLEIHTEIFTDEIISHGGGLSR